MRNSNSGGRDFRRDNSRFKGKNDGFRSRPGDREAKPMFKAVCAQCHKPCEVPFRPSGNKPVLCSFCFGEQKEGLRPERRVEHHSFAKESHSKPCDNSQTLKDIALKLDKIISLLSTTKELSKNLNNAELKIEEVKEKKEVEVEKKKEKKLAKPKSKKTSTKKVIKKKKK